MGSGLRGDGLGGDVGKAPVSSRQRGGAGWAERSLPTGQHPARHTRGPPLCRSEGNGEGSRGRGNRREGAPGARAAPGNGGATGPRLPGGLPPPLHCRASALGPSSEGTFRTEPHGGSVPGSGRSRSWPHPRLRLRDTLSEDVWETAAVHPSRPAGEPPPHRRPLLCPPAPSWQLLDPAALPTGLRLCRRPRLGDPSFAVSPEGGRHGPPTSGRFEIYLFSFLCFSPQVQNRPLSTDKAEAAGCAPIAARRERGRCGLPAPAPRRWFPGVQILLPCFCFFGL